MAVLYPTVKTKVDNGKGTMQDIEPFVVYSYLAEASDQLKYKAIVDVVRARIGAVGGGRRVRAKGGASSSAAAADNTAADAAVQSAMQMFA